MIPFLLTTILILMGIVIKKYRGISKTQFNELRNELHLIKEILYTHNLKLKQIMSTQAEVAQALTDLTAQVVKIGAESTKTLDKVTELEAALASQDNVSPALQAAFDGLKAQVQAVDDLIPDAPATPPTTEG